MIREENTVYNGETTKQNCVIWSWLEHWKIVAMDSSEGKQEHQTEICYGMELRQEDVAVSIAIK